MKTLDQALLVSPQLYRLAVSLPGLDITNHKSRSLWEQLKQILVHCRSLRSFTLDVHPDRTIPPLTDTTEEYTRNLAIVENRPTPNGEFLAQFTKDTVEIPLEPGEQLPSLEEVDIRAKTYNLDARHCAQLLHCMNWRKLKRLRLGPSNPKTFFETFKDKLSQLESLELSYLYEYQYYTPYRAYTPKLSACADFVASITTLKELVSTNYVGGSMPVIPSLRSLRISVRVNPSDHSLYSYIASPAHCAIRKVWSAYANDPRDCELETFIITFWCWEPTSPHPDENGFPRHAHMTKVVFDSRMRGGRLMIRPRNHPKVRSSFYSLVSREIEGVGLQAVYASDQQNVPELGFNGFIQSTLARGCLFSSLVR
ncbi:Nn.00g053480.m01.CDS01 [Neocucurbitaria sp. VM-36]